MDDTLCPYEPSLFYSARVFTLVLSARNEIEAVKRKIYSCGKINVVRVLLKISVKLCGDNVDVYNASFKVR
jgi:hypothetical protein